MISNPNPSLVYTRHTGARARADTKNIFRPLYNIYAFDSGRTTRALLWPKMEKANEIIISLISLIVSSLCENDSEWRLWGSKFVEISIRAQYQDSNALDVDEIINKIVDKFSTAVGKGAPFILEECLVDDFVIVHSLKSYLKMSLESEFLASVGDTKDTKFEEILKTFVSNMVVWSSRVGAYDARVRVVSVI